MNSGKKSGYNLANISRELSALASDLAQGKLRIGSRLIAVGEPLFFKTKQKIAGDKAYFTLSFQVPLPLPALEEDAWEEASPDPLQEGLKKQENKDAGHRERPPGGKKTKKEISALWKAISKEIEGGKAPEPSGEKKLLAACEEYNLFTERAWRAEWLACMDALRNALLAARNGDFNKAGQLVEEVNRLTRSCHKKYK